jgi:hypothetical protein
VTIDDEFARVDGVLRSAPGSRRGTVVLQTHPRRESYGNLGAWPMAALPATGIDTFAFNNRHTNSAAGIDVSTLWEPLALDVAAAVAEMRRRGYREVLLYGTSAGGPLSTFYQSVAEGGNAVFEGSPALSGFPGFVDRSGAELRLPPADGLVLQNATSGPATSFLWRLDASVVDESDAVRDPALDLFSPDNGFDPETGAGNYSEAFLDAYYAAQARRMNRLVLAAQERLDRIRTSGRPFLDDAFMVIPGVRACPAHVDLSVAHSTQGRWPHWPGGAVDVAVSDRPVIEGARSNRMRAEGTTVHTLTGFLSYRAVTADPARYSPLAVRAGETGVDHTSSHTSTATHVAGASVPLLVTAGTADVEVHLSTAELIHDSSVAADKTLAVVRGANHGMQDGTPDATGTRQTHLDVVRSWIADRYGA